MEIINGKAYKKLNIKDLNNEELVKMIEHLQNEIERLKSPGYSYMDPFSGGATTTNPGYSLSNTAGGAGGRVTTASQTLKSITGV